MKTLADMNFDWGGATYPAYQGYLNSPAAVTPAAPSSGAPSAASPTAPPAAPATPVTPAVPSSPASPAAAPTGPTAAPSPATAPDSNAENLAVIRRSHEFVQKFGGVEKVTPAIERYTKMYDTSKTLATQLGYSPESFEDAFAQDPGMIHQHLIGEARRAQAERTAADGQVPKEVRDLLNRELAPVRSVLQRQRAEAANRIVDSDFDTRLSSHSLFTGKSVPQGVKEAIYDRFVDLAVADQKTQQAILDNGDASGLAAHFDKAVADYFASVNAYNAWANGNGPQPGNSGGRPRGPDGQFLPAAAAPTSANPFSLQDVIDGEDNATKALPSLRNFAR